MKPNKANIRKWVKALRSGKYKQGIGALRLADKFCCLGVACDVFDKTRWVGGNIYLSRVGQLPQAVSQWLGIESSDPLLGNHRATQWNDDRGVSFKKIASLIERQFLKPNAQ